MRQLLVLSDSPLSDEIVQSLQCNGWRLDRAGDGDQARSLAEENGHFVGLALFPTEEDGPALREYADVIRDLPQVKWIAALNKNQVERAEIKSLIVECLYDFQMLPLDLTRISFALGHAYGIAQIGQELHERQISGQGGRFGLIGSSRVMLDLYRAIERAAACDLPVLVHGATGTGKEQVSRAIHSISSKADGPFVALNCAAIPPSLMHSELFGYEKRAFTHAFSSRQGYLEEASGGTLLLDAIGDMPLEAQASLLRFLEDQLITPLGGTSATKVDVRIIAATNGDLERLVEVQAFRADLYYRLAILSVHTPELWKRGDDILEIAQHFLREAADTTHAPVVGFQDEALAALRSHSWPGNLRELRNHVFQGVLNCGGQWVSRHDLGLTKPTASSVSKTLQSVKNEAERTTLETTLQRNQWNMSRAARTLKISRMTLYRLVDKHGLTRGK